MPRKWFKDFCKLNTNTNIIYFSINYDGFFKFTPKHKDDELVLKFFNKDQKSDKGIGLRAVGQDCTNIINTVFSKTHKTYVFNSNWMVENNKAFQEIFINFYRFLSIFLDFQRFSLEMMFLYMEIGSG